MKRRRSKQTDSFQHRVSECSARLREQADKLKLGRERDGLLAKVRRAHAAAQLQEWINSRRLKQPN